MNMKETWVTINHGRDINPNWPIAKNMYEISSLGRIRRKKTGNIYSQKNGRTYLCTKWYQNSDTKCSYQVSHIMAVEFLGYKNVFGKKIDLSKIIKEINN